MTNLSKIKERLDETFKADLVDFTRRGEDYIIIAQQRTPDPIALAEKESPYMSVVARIIDGRVVLAETKYNQPAPSLRIDGAFYFYDFNSYARIANGQLEYAPADDEGNCKEGEWEKATDAEGPIDVDLLIEQMHEKTLALKQSGAGRSQLE